MKELNVQKTSLKQKFVLSACNCGSCNCNCGAGSACHNKCMTDSSTNVQKEIKKIYKK